MLNLSQIKIEDIIKKSDNLIVIAILFVSLLIALKIYGKNNLSAINLNQKIDTQKKIGIILSDINTRAADIQEYRKKIFFEKDSSGLVSTVNDLARTAGVQIVSLRPLFLKEAGQLSILPIELEAKGDYYALGQFLSLIENYEGFIEIAALRITSVARMQSQGSQGENTLNISLSLKAYTLKELDVSEVFSKRR